MHTTLFLILALSGADARHPASSDGVALVSCDSCEAGCPHCTAGHGDGRVAGGYHARLAAAKIKHATARSERHMMPQTCYNPRYGCYTGSRYMHRYPAFHNTYYRRPYNYRNLFDYPWHADLHEPTSLFSYNVEQQEPPPGYQVPATVPHAPETVPSVPQSGRAPARSDGERYEQPMSRCYRVRRPSPM